MAKTTFVVATRVEKGTKQAISKVLKTNHLTLSDFLRDLIEKDLRICPRCGYHARGRGESHE